MSRAALLACGLVAALIVLSNAAKYQGALSQFPPHSGRLSNPSISASAERSLAPRTAVERNIGLVRKAADRNIEPITTPLEDATNEARRLGLEADSHRSVVRQRFVKFRDPGIRALLRDQARRGDELELELFDGERLRLRLESLDPVGPGARSVVWRADVVGQPSAEATLAVRDGEISGSIALPLGRVIEVRPETQGLSSVAEIDLDSLPPGGDPVVRAGEAGPGPVLEGSDRIRGAAPSDHVIDLLAVYTPAAAAGAGGAAALEARTELAVSRANAAYARSGVNQSLRLVHQQQVEYRERGFSADLHTLGDPRGSLRDVHSLRDARGADVVALITASRGLCGIGFIIDPRRRGSDGSGFSVNAWRCVGASYTLAHEIGHNQGLWHDRRNSRGTPATPYGHGYQNPGHFRTIMAYPCDRARCDTVGHFSNPSVAFEGRPTGVFDREDSARALRETSAEIASWRAGSGVTACRDGIDNDGDRLTDDLDPGCRDGDDPSERDPALPCDDGRDNDGDGLIDVAGDPGCADPEWPTESPQCDDGIDNDGDGAIDFADSSCTRAFPASEQPLIDGCGRGAELVAFIPFALALGRLRTSRFVKVEDEDLT